MLFLSTYLCLGALIALALMTSFGPSVAWLCSSTLQQTFAAGNRVDILDETPLAAVTGKTR